MSNKNTQASAPTQASGDVAWDKWALLEEYLKKSTESKEKTKLLCVCIASLCNPLALFVAKELEKLRKTSKIPVLIFDADVDSTKFWDVGVSVLPAIIFFYGQHPVRIRRTGFPDDYKIAGSLTTENLNELLQTAKSADTDGERLIQADF